MPDAAAMVGRPSGRPIFWSIASHAPFGLSEIAPSAKAILFGDFSKYFIRRITGARVLRLVERYADYNQTGFVAFQRWDGALVDAGTHPIKYLQMSS